MCGQYRILSLLKFPCLSAITTALLMSILNINSPILSRKNLEIGTSLNVSGVIGVDDTNYILIEVRMIHRRAGEHITTILYNEILARITKTFLKDGTRLTFSEGELNPRRLQLFLRCFEHGFIIFRF
jgi:hypothetical protein